MGARDPRLDVHGNTDFRLSRLLRLCSKQDPPSDRVKPIPIQVVKRAVDTAYRHQNEGHTAVADMMCIGFFFLMRPGEHTFTRDNTPFKLADVRLFRDTVEVDWRTAPARVLGSCDSGSLQFTTQKNGVKGEVITHGVSGDVNACPIRALARRLLYHRHHHSPDHTPLCRVHHDQKKPHCVTSKSVSLCVRETLTATSAEGHTFDILPRQVEARSLRAGGATALLAAGVDDNHIQLIGRWKSDAMIRYLHIHADPRVHTYAKKMCSGGHCSFRPGLTVPMY